MSNGDDILSQEEIDALMNQDDEENADNELELTEVEIDIMGEIGNIAMGSAATALYTLLDQKVEITAPAVEIKTFKEITEEYTRPCVLVKVKYKSGLEGINLLIINARDAAVIADLMMGGDGTNPAEELDEIHTSAVGEAMNQMMGSASTAMSSIIDDMVNISPPETEYLDLNDAVDAEGKYFASEEPLVTTSFQLKIGDLVDSSFKQLAPKAFTRELARTLMENESGLTAKDDNAQQQQVSSVKEGELSAATAEQAAGTGGEQQQPRTAARVQESTASGQDGQENQQQHRTDEAARSNRVEKEDKVGVQSAQFPDFDNGSAEPLPQNMELIKDVPLRVTVRLGKARMTIQEVLDLGEGSIVELDKLAGEPVNLYVNGKLVAKGEVVVIDENFGFRVKDIVSPMDRINNI
ncbi:MAG: flagellar motor switch phosphatase FliY [Bacillota bacterium]